MNPLLSTAAPDPPVPDRRWLHFGGSFDPVHHGHLIVSRAAAEAAGLDGVNLILSNRSPHKTDTPPTAAADRLRMLELAVEGDGFFRVDGRELDRPPPSYTSDTCRKLLAETGRVDWLIGGDQVEALPRWHDWHWLRANVRFWCARRPDAPPPEGVEVEVLDTPLLEISSTAIRRRAAAGQSVRHLVPRSVAAYVEDRGLYRSLGAVD